MNYKQLVINYLEQEGIKYQDTGDFSISVSYGGDNMKSVAINVFFDKDGDNVVQFDCWTIANFKGKETAAYKVCNELNAQYRWVKFFVDNDGDIRGQIDACIDEESCGAECLELVQRSVNIIDGSYPAFMKARWSD